MTDTVLILGASGKFGRNAAEAFWNKGWQVRLFDRETDDLMTAAQGVDVIVNAWNPAYPDWERDVPKLTQDVIEAAQWHDVTVLVPGNVYVYGAGAPAKFSPETSHKATNPLGQVRIAMEDAYRVSGVRTILLRAGDFIDTQASGNWFDRIMTAKIDKGRLTYPGPLEVPHAWAFLPDMAEAAVDLCEMRDQLPVFADVPYAGYTLSGHQMAEALTVVMEHPVKAKRMSWTPLRMMALVSPLMRCLVEMRYLWSKPHMLDPEPLASLLPGHRPTPVPAALARAVDQNARSTQTGKWRDRSAKGASRGQSTPLPTIRRSVDGNT